LLVVVAAHGGLWALYRDPHSVLGWVAARAAVPDWVSLGGQVRVESQSAGWLGAADLEPERIVGNLLDCDGLPVDLHLSEPFLSIRRHNAHVRANMCANPNGIFEVTKTDPCSYRLEISWKNRFAAC
jgi:hypothetical protein